MRHFGKRYHAPGTSPGTLEKPEPGRATPPRIHLVDIQDSEFTERDGVTLDDCKPYFHGPSITWIHIQGQPDPAILQTLGDAYGLHPLALEDVLNAGQRTKVDIYENQLFIVLGHLRQVDDGFNLEQVSIFLGERYVVSFHDAQTDIFEPVRERLRKPGGRLRTQGADYLAYALVDLVIDHGFPVLEAMGDSLEELEELVVDEPVRSTMEIIHRTKRKLIVLRRALWPQREVINSLIRDSDGLIDESTKLYFRDCYDHTVQILDLIEAYRDTTSGLLDVYLSSVSNRMNDIMKVLTIIATIFIPLSFITGVYGMNFDTDKSPWNMPELDWYYGYPLALGLMLAIAIVMLIYFRRRNWI